MKVDIKKLIAIALVFILALSMAGTALAVEEEPILAEIQEATAAEEVPEIDEVQIDEVQIEESMAVSEAAEPVADAATAERSADNLSFNPGEILVVFNEGVTEAAASLAAEEFGGAVVQSIDALEGIYAGKVEIPLDLTVAQAIEQFSQNPAVEFAQPNMKYKKMEDPDSSFQWQHGKINTGESWAMLDGLKNRNKVRVAVIDGAADITHVDLRENSAPETDCVSIVDGTKYRFPANGYDEHGTHVAGIIAATANNEIRGVGVASGESNSFVEIVAIDVFAGQYSYTEDIILGMRHAADMDCKVINMSLGREENPFYPEDDRMFESAVNEAVSKGITVVASAGNDGNQIKNYPADFDNVISVINTMNYNKTTDICKEGDSNYGATKDISAPGAGILSCTPGNRYEYMSGTSMASPVVAGVAALMMYADSALTPSKLRNIMTQTATDLYTPGFDIYTAYGNVNAEAAIEKVLGLASKLPAPSGFSAKSASYNSIKLSWKAVSGAEGYVISYSSSKNGNYIELGRPSANATSFVHKNAKTGKAYYYRIKAYKKANGKNVMGSLTSPVSAQALVPAPTGFSAKSAGENSINLSWKKSTGASGYYIYRATAANGKYTRIKTISSGSTISYTDAKCPKANTKYYYKIRPYRTVDKSSVAGVTGGPVSAKTASK